MQARGLVMVVLGAGCFDSGADHGTRDAGGDAAIDAPSCGGDRRPLSGKLLDLDSTNAQPVPVAAAHVIFGAAPDAAAFTRDDGSFLLCVGATDPVVMELDAPAGYLDGTIYIEGVFDELDLTLRTFTEARAVTFYTERSLAFQASKAHVLALNTFDPSDLTLDRTHDPAQAGNDDSGTGLVWAAGNVGRYVLFPNVDTSSPNATLTEPNPPAGIRNHTIPIEAGKLTLAAVSWALVGP